MLHITSLIVNRGLLATDGIDCQVHYGTDLPDVLALFDGAENLTVGPALTHVYSPDVQEKIVTQVYDYNGFFGWPCQALFGNLVGTYPKNKLIANIHYGSGPFTGHLGWR